MHYAIEASNLGYASVPVEWVRSGSRGQLQVLAGAPTPPTRSIFYSQVRLDFALFQKGGAGRVADSSPSSRSQWVGYVLTMPLLVLMLLLATGFTLSRIFLVLFFTVLWTCVSRLSRLAGRLVERRTDPDLAPLATGSASSSAPSSRRGTSGRCTPLECRPSSVRPSFARRPLLPPRVDLLSSPVARPDSSLRSHALQTRFGTSRSRRAARRGRSGASTTATTSATLGASRSSSSSTCVSVSLSCSPRYAQLLTLRHVPQPLVWGLSEVRSSRSSRSGAGRQADLVPPLSPARRAATSFASRARCSGCVSLSSSSSAWTVERTVRRR